MVNDNFIPVRVHARDQAGEFQRLGEQYGAQWTPATLVISPDGKERHRWEGFVGTDDFLAQLGLGLGQAAFARGDWDAAERAFNDVATEYPQGDAAPEATYWAGVSRYKRSGDGSELVATRERLDEKYAGSTWARKAAVWR
jgi:hypothetical protein